MSERSLEPQLNATPLIDVLLVLLVMLIFTLPIATHTVKLNLPQGRHAPPAPPASAIRLDIVYDGGLYWNGEPVASLEALVPRLSAIGARADAPLLEVMPERRAPYGRVAQVLAAAQRSHVSRLTVSPVSD